MILIFPKGITRTENVVFCNTILFAIPQITIRFELYDQKEISEYTYSRIY